MEVILNDGQVMTYDQLAHTSAKDLRLIVAAGGALATVEPQVVADSGCVCQEGRLGRPDRLQRQALDQMRRSRR